MEIGLYRTATVMGVSWGRLWLVVVLSLGLAGAAPADSARQGGRPAKGDFGFHDFCQQWLNKLQVREQSNRRLVSWKRVNGIFTGEYTGYGKIDGCSVKLRPGEQPVGRVSYREFTYRLEGSSREAAERSAVRIVGETEVTEIFRYSGGRWQY